MARDHQRLRKLKSTCLRSERHSDRRRVKQCLDDAVTAPQHDAFGSGKGWFRMQLHNEHLQEEEKILYDTREQNNWIHDRTRWKSSKKAAKEQKQRKQQKLKGELSCVC